MLCDLCVMERNIASARFTAGILCALLLVRNSLSPEERLKTPIAIEATPARLLHTTVRKHRLVTADDVSTLLSSRDDNKKDMTYCTVMLLICTAPDSTSLAILNPRAKLSVNTAPLSPYSVSFAISIASSSLSTPIKLTIGPKDSV